MTLDAHARALLPDLVALRRAIHADPELGGELPRTRERVLAALHPLGLEVTLGRRQTSLAAVLRGGRAGPTVLLRGDMDALPMAEQTGLSYASTGTTMHACGHDLHTAGLVGAAHLLHGVRDELEGDVVFLFQPAEETGDGALTMIDEGMLEVSGSLPIAAYGIHVVPGEFGVFSTRPGTIMAGAIELGVRLIGEGGHASAPHLAVDPVPVAAEIVLALQSFATRAFDALDPVVLSVTQIQAGGEARNVIAGEVTLGASIRVLSAVSQERVIERVPQLIDGIASAHGVTAEVELTVLCPPTVNDDSRTETALSTLADAFGDERVRRSPAPVMGSEDFSYILERIPGTWMFLRATPPALDPGAVAPNHHPRAVFDDGILADQAVALATLAREALRG